MKNTGILISAVLIIAAGVIGYLLGSSGKVKGNIEKVSTDVKNVEIETPKFKLVTLAEQVDSGEVGIATIREVDGKVKVSIHVVGEPETATQPAHIHSGACPTPGPISYNLNSVVDGESETILDITYDSLDSQPQLAVNLHESQANLANYVARGNLTD